MRISDWSSDVCSSDLLDQTDADAFIEHFVERLMSRNGPPLARATLAAVSGVSGEAASALALGPDFNHVTISVRAAGFEIGRASCKGKSVSVRVDLGGRRIIKKKNKNTYNAQ